jgi:microcompartment protein CcmK/EutM
VQLGRVVGRVWASIKNPGLEGQRLLVVQPVLPDLTPHGKPLVCTDSTGAGAGELIYWVRGREATFPFLPGEVASDACIVGIVDEIHLGKKQDNAC